MWLKALVAVTCIAVLGAIGYFFWIEYQRGAANIRAQDIAGARESCLFALQRYAERELADPNSEEMAVLVNECVNRGLISASDINAAASRRFN